MCPGKVPGSGTAGKKRDQSLGPGILQRTDRPLQHPADKAGCWRVDWTSAAAHDTEAHRSENGCTDGDSAG